MAQQHIKEAAAVDDHIDSVEAWLNRKDPVSMYMAELERKIERLGLAGLNETEQMYAALCTLLEAIFNGMELDFFSEQPDGFVLAARNALVQTGHEALLPAYDNLQKLSQSHASDTWHEELEYEVVEEASDPFVTHHQALCVALDAMVGLPVYMGPS